MKIVFATAEVSPIAKTGGLGDVCGALPKALVELGHEVVIWMPFYRQAREWFEGHDVAVETLQRVELSWAGWTEDVTYYRTALPGTSIPLLMAGNERYFDRAQLYAPNAEGRDDGLDRYALFCRAVIRGCELLGIAPDILHCHDWHTALLPVYLHSGLNATPLFRRTRSIYSIHNLNYQGVSPAGGFSRLGLHSRYWAPDALEHYGEINPMKGGILFADQVNTVSPTYAREVMTPAYGAGLDGVLRRVTARFYGILNGIDTKEWNPATDPFLDARFDAADLRGKSVQKEMLQREAELAADSRVPLIGVVSRLVEQKGFQLFIPVLERLLTAGAQVVIVGSGDREYESAFAQIAARNRGRCRAWIGFDNARAHRVYAGCDMLLMPSLYEPCGLNQMYSLRYGSLPVVRLTGGLADTVVPFNGINAGEANGFGFTAPAAEELYFATWIAMLNYRDAGIWRALQQNAMAADFSWESSARQYLALYERALRS